MREARRIGALLVDDSAVARRLIGSVLETSPDVQLLGEASDGQEALRLAADLQPDVILLDLEMPRMDGFTFLRFLRARSATPVLVLSRHSSRSDVRRALELGANGFVQKPLLGTSVSLAEARALLDRIRSLRQRDAPAAPGAEASDFRVVLVGASTGGPTAVQRILAALELDLRLAVVVAQHMPARFTAAFAERLDRASAFAVREARDGDPVLPGQCLVAPGGRNLAIAPGPSGPRVALHAPSAAAGTGRYVPSIDLLFGSAAELLGPRAIGVVLTGMGDDGREGLRTLRAAGALTLAEAQETAVVFGMPKAAVEGGGVFEVLGLQDIIERLRDAGKRTPTDP